MVVRVYVLALLALTACSKTDASAAPDNQAGDAITLKCEGTNVVTHKVLPSKSEAVAIILRFRPTAKAVKGINDPRPVELVQELKGMSALVGAVNWCQSGDCVVDFSDTKILHDADRTANSGGYYRFEISRLTGDYKASADMGNIGLHTETGRCTMIDESEPKF